MTPPAPPGDHDPLALAGIDREGGRRGRRVLRQNCRRRSHAGKGKADIGKGGKFHHAGSLENAGLTSMSATRSSASIWLRNECVGGR